MKPTINIWFCDCPWMDKLNNRFVRALERHFNVHINENIPDIVFYSCFGTEHLKYDNPIKIFFNGENVFPNFNICDYAIGCLRDSISGRNLYQPCALYLYNKNIQLPEITQNALNRKFCSFIYSQDKMGEGAVLRKTFCKLLMKHYKLVDCPGKILHNIDAPELEGRNNNENWHDSKVKFLSNYKFNIAFENSNTDGYITEKLLDPYMANSVPIYWGSEGNTCPFPKDSMICANDYPDMLSLIQRIIEVDTNDDLYLSMLSKNPLRKNFMDDPIDELERFLLPIAMNPSHRITKDPGYFDPIHSVRDFAMLPHTRLSKIRKFNNFLQKITELFSHKN